MKIRFSKNGFVEKFFIDEKNIINPWGIETSDSKGFFTLNEKSCRSIVLKKDIKKDGDSFSGFVKVKLPNSYWKINISEKFSKNTVIRKNKLCCLSDCEFNDFVSRFRFKKKFVDSVEIAGKKLFHKDSNVYHQFPIKKIVLNLISGKKILIELRSYKTIDGLEPVMYARDSGDEWIVHARMFPTNPKIKQIKILRPWYNKAIPQLVSNVLLKIKPVHDFLWYRGERKGYFPVGAYGLVRGKKGDILELETSVSIE